MALRRGGRRRGVTSDRQGGEDARRERADHERQEQREVHDRTLHTARGGRQARESLARERAREDESLRAERERADALERDERRTLDSLSDELRDAAEALDASEARGESSRVAVERVVALALSEVAALEAEVTNLLADSPSDRAARRATSMRSTLRRLERILHVARGGT